MEFNFEKCHLLLVIRKRSLIPSSYTLHGQTLEFVRDAKHLGDTITNNLHWGTHVSPCHGESVAAKATRISTFTHQNLKGCTTNSRPTAIRAWSNQFWNTHRLCWTRTSRALCPCWKQSSADPQDLSLGTSVQTEVLH
jgi:hypothetical protein